MSCLDCGGSLRVALDLGNLPIVGFPSPGPAPLRLAMCDQCGLTQLADLAPVSSLYRDYWYRGSTNETMVAELRDVVASAQRLVPSAREVLDIGANDGTLLRQYDASIKRCAVEPSEMFAQDSPGEMHTGFWPEVLTANRVGRFAGRRFDIITSIAMWNHVRDRQGFIAAVAAVLAPHGVWIVQWQDLLQMIDATAVDNIVHEHVTYDTLGTFIQALHGSGLQVREVERRRINGGSLRIVVGHGYETAPTSQPCALTGFVAQVARMRETVRRTVEEAALRGPIDVYGASTKGCTLLHWAGLDHRQIRQAIERSPDKIGRTVGATGIPIVSEADGRRDPAPTWLVPIWQFRDAVIAREQAYLAGGGRMIFPLPSCEQVPAA